MGFYISGKQLKRDFNFRMFLEKDKVTLNEFSENNQNHTLRYI